MLPKCSSYVMVRMTPQDSRPVIGEKAPCSSWIMAVLTSTFAKRPRMDHPLGSSREDPPVLLISRILQGLQDFITVSGVKYCIAETDRRGASKAHSHGEHGNELAVAELFVRSPLPTSVAAGGRAVCRSLGSLGPGAYYRDRQDVRLEAGATLFPVSFGRNE